VEDCSRGAECTAKAGSTAEIEDCGVGTADTSFNNDSPLECEAEADSEAEVEDCTNGAKCEATSIAGASASDGAGGRALADSFAYVTGDGSATAVNVAVAEGDNAGATSTGGCVAIFSDCSAPNLSVAKGPDATASATIPCDVNDEPDCKPGYGNAYATNNSTADQSATAISISTEAGTSLAVAGSDANAANYSTAEADAKSKAIDAAGEPPEFECVGGQQVEVPQCAEDEELIIVNPGEVGGAHTSATANACIDHNGVVNGIGCYAGAGAYAKAVDDAFAAGISDALSLQGGSAYSGSESVGLGPDSIAVAGALSAATGANNNASAGASSYATESSMVVVGSNATSNVGEGAYGAAIGLQKSRTFDDVSCGTAYGNAAAKGSNGGDAEASADGYAFNGESVNAAVGAHAGTPCTGGPTGPYATFAANDDGSWSFSTGSNVGAACVQTSVTASPTAP
jgi:hypothetical protein